MFRLVRLNKTPYRSSLSLDDTLPSILTVKLHDLEPCYQFEPSNKMLKKSEKKLLQNTTRNIGSDSLNGVLLYSVVCIGICMYWCVCVCVCVRACVRVCV